MHIFATQSSPVNANKVDANFAEILTYIAARRFARHVSEFGALPAATRAVNSVAFNAAFAWLIVNGGGLMLEPGATYDVDSTTLDVRYTATTQKSYVIVGYGARLNFYGSGKTSGAGLRCGATALNVVPELAKSRIEMLELCGPEIVDNMIPESQYRDTAFGTEGVPGSGGKATASTTTVGILREYALGVSLENTLCTQWWKGYETFYSWHYRDEHPSARTCIIGFDYDTGCTEGIVSRPSSEFCTYAGLIQPLTSPGTAAIGVLNIDAPHVETCTVGWHIDPLDAAGTAEIDNVHFTGTAYLENILRDQWRIGISFNPDPNDAHLVGANRVGKIVCLKIDGWRCAGAGLDSAGTAYTEGYSDKRKAIRFSTGQNVCSGYIRGPCERGDIVNLQPHLGFEGTIKSELRLTQNVHTIRPGEFWAHIGSTGTIVWCDSPMLVSVAHPGTGQYTLTLAHALEHENNAAILAIPRTKGYSASVDGGLNSTTTFRVEVANLAGALSDQAFMVLVKGELAPLP